MTGAPPQDALRARLAASRSALLHALEGITEREFAAELEPGRSVVRALAELAAAERGDVARARGAAGATRIPEKPLPPQVIHDLAGARYRTETLVGAPGGVEAVALAALVEGIAAREEVMAARIEALKPPRAP
jgi:hypothetical protein